MILSFSALHFYRNML